MAQVTYTIRYQYGTYSGERTVTLDSNDDRDPKDVMWAQMRRRGELTLGMASQSARIVSEERNEDEE